MKYLRFFKKKVILSLSALLALALLVGVMAPWTAEAANPPVSGTVKLDTYSLWRSQAIVSHSVASGPYRLLAVAVMVRADESVNSVTYADQSLLLAKAHDGGGADQQRVEIWYLVNPPVGTADLLVHLADSANPSAIAVVNFTGVHQTSPIGETAGTNGTGINVTTSITTLNADSLIFGAASARGGDTEPFAPGTDISELWDDATGSDNDDDDGLWGGELEAPTTRGYTFNATSSVSDDWAIACVELKAAPVPSFTTIVADKVAYKDGDTVTLTVTLADNNTACTLTAEFSNIDDQYISGGESVVNWGTDGVDNNSDGHTDEPAEQGIYVITYGISAINARANGSYSVPVTATDGVGNSTTDSTTLLALDNTAPPSPTNLSATAVAGGDIELSWTASSPEDDVANYNIYRSTSSGGQNYSSYTYQVSVGTTTYTDTSTIDGTTYYYVVRADDIAGNTDSNTTEDSATADATAPPAPTNLSATALTGGDIELNWTASSPETDVANYNIYRATTSGGQNYSSATYQVSSGTTTYTDTSTTDGITYYYVVRAQDNVGNIETNINEASATAGVTEAPSFSSITSDESTYKDGDTIILTVTLANHNTGCTLTANFSNIDDQYATGGEAVLNWGTDNIDNDGDGHIDNLAEQGIYVITYLISTVNGQADASYSVSVTATDAASNSASSSISLDLDNTAPSAPTGLIATAIAGEDIELSWTASSSGDLAQYNIYKATSSGGQNYSTPTYTVSSGTTTYTDTSTTDGVTYYYLVRAQDNVGNIETNTNEASATAGVIGAPSFSSIVADSSGYKDGDTIELTVTLANHNTGCTLTANFSNIDDQYATGGEAVLNWGTDNIDNDGDGHTDGPSEQGVYVIEYLISTVNTKADGSYSVPVTATDAASNSASSSISLDLDNTPSSAPTNLSATALSAGGIELSWTASSSGDLAQYNIYRATSSGGQSYTSPTYTVSSGTTTYTDTATTDGTTYYYLVRAQDNVGNIETNTNEASATAGVTEAPSFSSITSDESTYKDGDTITLTVTLANHNTGCTLTANFSNIDDQYATGGESVANWGTDGADNDGDGHIDNLAEQGIYVITYLISTVNGQADASYSVSVTATDAASNSASSSISLDLDNTPSSAPTNLSATAVAGGSIQLTWIASSSGDLAQYNIYKATSSGGQNYSTPTYTVSSGTTTYTDTSTTDGVTYYYVVRAQDNVGNIETNTNEASATAGVTEAPSFSSITSDESTYKDGDTITLTVTLANHNTGCTLTANFSNIDSQYVTGGEAVLNWGTDNIDNDGDGHTDGPSEQGVYVIEYLISTVNTKADGSYSVPVTATDAASNSASSSISLDLDNTPSFAPTNLSATAVAGGSIQLTWIASSSGDLAQYNIYKATSSGGQNYSTPTYTVSSGTTTYTDTSTTNGVTYYYVVRAQDAAGNIETNTNEASATVGVIGSSVSVSHIYIEYGREVLYNLASSTDSGVPAVFARGKVDEVYLRLNLVGGFELNKTSSSIILFRGIGDDAEEVPGSKEIKEGSGWAEFILHIDPPFDPDVDEHSRDALYWVDVSVARTTGTINDFDFYFIYDTISPAVPDFGITSFTPSSGTISVSGKTWPDSSDPQQVEIFLNSTSQGVVTADGAGNFNMDNLILVSGDNYIAVQSTDRAGNKSELSAFLRQRYNSQNLLSIAIRSSHVIKSGSATIPVEIIYAVTEPAQVTIHIHNLLGETVKEWSEWVNPGEELEWSWLGDNMYGGTVNNGVYIIKVIADNGSGRKENVTKLLGVLR